jgi:hypothetical protein
LFSELSKFHYVLSSLQSFIEFIACAFHGEETIEKAFILEVHRLSAYNRYRPIIGHSADNQYQLFNNRPIIGHYRLSADTGKFHHFINQINSTDQSYS